MNCAAADFRRAPYAEAEALAEKHLMARPMKQMSYQPVGDLRIDSEFGESVAEYRRALDLDTAIATSFYSQRHRYTREAFVSPVDGVIVVRSPPADRERAFSCRISIGAAAGRTGSGGGHRSEPGGEKWRQRVGIAGRLTFAIASRMSARQAAPLPTGAALRVEGADEALVFLDAATSFRPRRHQRRSRRDLFDGAHGRCGASSCRACATAMSPSISACSIA